MKLFYSTALTFILILLPSASSAINKCIVDGRTRYQNSACPKGSETKFAGTGVFSTLQGKTKADSLESKLRQQNAQAQYNQLSKKIKSDQAE